MARTTRRRMVSVAALAGLTVAVMAMAACSSDNDTSNTGGSGVTAGAGAGGDDSDGGFSLGPTLTVTFNVTGEDGLTGSTTATGPTDNGVSPQTCADYAKGATADDGKIHYNLPNFLNDKIGGKKVLIGALVEDYKGPGTYQLDDMSGQGTPPGIEVNDRPYVDQPDISSGQVDIDAKGGGTWTFTRLAFSDGSGTVSPGINGTVSWTCKD